MARKSFKREPTQSVLFTDDLQTQSQQDPPMGSGDTILIDSDVTMTDEGYETNQVRKTSNRATPSSNQNRPATTFPSHAGHDEEGGLQVLGRGVKELVQAVQALRHLGIEDELPLPKIAVVGDQSTGKSSLIEGMSEIKVPRGTDEQWRCQIFLRKEYVYEGNLGNGRILGKTASKAEGATRSRPLGPWVQQESESFPFATLASKQDVPHVLYLAQLATLNPGSPYEKYLPGNTQPKDEHQVKFSPNVVGLDISGPGLPNLSFFDLPGVINVSEVAGEEYLVDLVKNLVKDYIKDPNCINLLALPMTDDPANSSASRLVREVKAEARTVGCLTKPDRMQEGESLEQWIQILGGQRFRLGLGYHVIKNNPNAHVDHATARREEETFFEEEEPWTTALNPYSSRFGTLQLQTALSQRLTAQIRKSLPLITEKVQRKAELVDKQLKELPEPLDGNLAVSVMGELIKFERLLEKHIDGGSETFPFQKDWHLTAVKFRQALVDTRPVLMLPSPQTPLHSQSLNTLGSTSGTPTPAARNQAPIAIDSDESDDEESPSKPSPNLQRIGQKRPTLSSQSTPMKALRTLNTTSPFMISSSSSKRFNLREVHNIIQDGCISLPGLIDPKAIERMIIMSMEHWEVPVDKFLDQTKQLCEDMVFEQVQEVYGKYCQTQYYETIRQICETFFDKAFYEQRQLIKRVLSWELSKPKTFNEEAMNLAKEKALTLLQTKRREVRANAYLDEQETRAGKASTGQARIEKLAKITDSLLGPDIYSKEIIAMSTVKGYYECAYSRFVDIVCASVHCELFAKCRNDIVKGMRRNFGLTEAGVEERLAILLAANPVQEQRRAQLKKEMDTIAKAQERLEGLTGDE